MVLDCAGTDAGAVRRPHAPGVSLQVWWRLRLLPRHSALFPVLRTVAHSAAVKDVGIQSQAGGSAERGAVQLSCDDRSRTAHSPSETGDPARILDNRLEHCRGSRGRSERAPLLEALYSSASASTWFIEMSSGAILLWRLRLMPWRGLAVC